jgi:hypothetical protein
MFNTLFVTALAGLAYDTNGRFVGALSVHILALSMCAKAAAAAPCSGDI